VHTVDERRSLVADILCGIDSAVADLDRAIDALTETAAPGRAYRMSARRRDVS